MTKGKRVVFKLIVAALLPPLLSACASTPAGPYLYGTLIKTPFAKVDYGSYYKVGKFDSLSSNGYTIDTDFSHIFQSGNTNLNMPTTGDAPLLVVPVDFSDRAGTSHDLEAISAAFTGNKALNQFVSVAEFYSIASMDRLHVRPTVLSSFFRSPTYSSIPSLSNITSSSGTTNALTKIYEEALTWLKGMNFDVASYSFTSLSGKSVLPIYFVYTAPYAGETSGEGNRNSMMWAFTINRPAPIAWSSVDMLHESAGKVDAHTFIHETGHLFGLEDYYDTSSSELLSRTSHLGRMDIMDSSLGDHNAFSKMLLGWETPYVPKESCEITIRQSSGNNECVLYAPSWNNTLFDSYLLFEFYTPTNLNYTDAFLRSDETMRLFQKPGVKVYKVDATLALYNGYYSTGKELDSTNYTGGRLYFNRHNSSFSSPLIQLLNKHQNTSAPTPYYIASDHEADLRMYKNGNGSTAHLSDALFYQGDSIDSEHFADLRIKGKELGCTIKVSEVTSSFAKISFTFPSK